jgi:hypothetical protein
MDVAAHINHVSLREKRALRQCTRPEHRGHLLHINHRLSVIDTPGYPRSTLT